MLDHNTTDVGVDDREASFHPEYDISLGTVVVYDRHDERDVVQWKAMADGHSVISDSPMDAVMGVMQQLKSEDL